MYGAVDGSTYCIYMYIYVGLDRFSSRDYCCYDVMFGMTFFLFFFYFQNSSLMAFILENSWRSHAEDFYM